MKSFYFLIAVLIGIPVCFIVWGKVFQTLDDPSDQYASLTNQIQKDLDKSDKNKETSSASNFDQRLKLLHSNGFKKEPTLNNLFPNPPKFIFVYKNQYSVWYVDKSSVITTGNTKSALSFNINTSNNLDSFSLDNYNCLENTFETIASYLSNPVDKIFPNDKTEKIKIVATTPKSELFNYVCKS